MKKHHFSQKEEDVVREADEESAGTLAVTLCCRWVMTGLGSGVTDSFHWNSDRTIFTTEELKIKSGPWNIVKLSISETLNVVWLLVCFGNVKEDGLKNRKYPASSSSLGVYHRCQSSDEHILYLSALKQMGYSRRRAHLSDSSK